ncbi:MAG: Cna B-type domain-containing protein [Eubacterium ramulus]
MNGNSFLQKMTEGTNIVYRVTADAPEDYTAKVTGSADDGFVVTYSHEIAKTSVTASVEWDDADDKDGIRPKSVSFQLKADGENVGDAVYCECWQQLDENLGRSSGEKSRKSTYLYSRSK